MSIFIYMLFSRAFMYLKQWFGTENDKDPFQNLMISSEEDFLGNNNIILQNFVLQLDNILILSYVVYFWLTPDIDEMTSKDLNEPFRKEIRNGQIPMLVAFMIIFFVMIWRGTGFRDFFSNFNLITLTVSYAIFIMINVVTYLSVYKNEEDSGTFDITIGIPKATNIFYITYFVAAMWYHGRCKKVVRRKGRAPENAEDPMQTFHMSIIDSREAV